MVADPAVLQWTPCPLCRQDSSRQLVSARDWRHGSPGEFAYVRCNHCDLVYANPRVPPEQIHRFYPDEYGSFQRRGGEGVPAAPPREFFKKLRRSALLSKCANRIGRAKSSGHPPLRSLLSRLASHTVTCRKSPLHFHGLGLRLLDVGAGTGDFLRQMRALGWEVEGIEPDARALELCREDGLKVEGATIENAVLPAESFDVITLWQTMEHIADPAEVLKKILAALTPGGLLVGSMPNAASWNRLMQGKYWWGYDPPRHYIIFSPASVRKGFELTGFHTRWLYCLSSTKGVYAGRAVRAKAEGREFRPPMPTWALRIGARLLDRLGVGDNLWFVGQKPFER